MTRTPNDEIPTNGYAVVWYGYDGKTPKICKVLSGGVVVDGSRYAIYATAEAAGEQFLVWPHQDSSYGILPVRFLVEEQPRYILKTSVK